MAASGHGGRGGKASVERSRAVNDLTAGQEPREGMELV